MKLTILVPLCAMALTPFAHAHGEGQRRQEGGRPHGHHGHHGHHGKKACAGGRDEGAKACGGDKAGKGERKGTGNSNAKSGKAA